MLYRVLILLGMKIFKLLLIFFIGFVSYDLEAQCSASFSYSDTACTGSSVSFSANTTSTGLKYGWEFGDPASGNSNTDTFKTTSHTFTNSGTYSVTLIVYNLSGTCRDSVTQKIDVFAKPRVAFKWKSACAGMLTEFLDSTTFDTKDSIVKYDWTLDGSTSSSLQNPSKTYTITGTQNITLAVLTNAGCVDTLTRVLQVFAKPTASVSDTQICQNATVRFTAATQTGAQNYRWDFGDSTAFTQRVVDHVYQKTGWMFPTLTVDYTSTSCTVPVDSILVNPLPDASFDLSQDTLCYSGNELCVTLRSNSGVATRNVIFDDGFVDDFSPFSDTVICHSYIDPKGGSYSITVELTDSNGCSSTIEKKDAVVVLPVLRASYTTPVTQGCFSTNVKLTNTTNRDSAAVDSVIWIWGDTSAIEYSPYYKPNHTYTKNGLLKPMLVIQDTFGCRDTFTASTLLRNTSYVVDARIDSIYSQCLNGNRVSFFQSKVPGASYEWKIPYSVKSNAYIYRYSLATTYPISFSISVNGCDSTVVFDSLVIYGPRAYIGDVVNRYQCQNRDTVYFKNRSYAYKNKHIQAFWSAGDLGAGNCVIDTKNGVNVGSNCNYSKDSLNFKHFYASTRDSCYLAKLVVRDTVIGCSDSTILPVPLMKPSAKGALIPSDTFACPGPDKIYQDKSVKFTWTDTLKPSCVTPTYWIMWDSAAAARSGNFSSYWEYYSREHNYTDLDAGDSSGYVTIGLIVANGIDSLGVPCRDTAWFPKVIRVNRMNPNFTSSYDDSIHFCAGDVMRFSLVDSNQTKNTRFKWNFGDGTIIDTTSQSSQFHSYSKSGSYYVSLFVTTPDGCILDSGMWVHVGTRAHFTTSSSLLCAGLDSLTIVDSTEYYPANRETLGYFSNTARNNTGKEKLLFDLGDGAGFQTLGESLKFTYNKPGYFRISMIAIDSTGCRDTVSNHVLISSSGVYPGFKTNSDTFLCPQTVKFNSTATTYDSANSAQLPGDRIVSWTYNFGALYPQSLFENPARYFTSGTYNVTQIVRNSQGCTDSISKKIHIVGPISRFDFVGDSIGCSPLDVEFKNNSFGANEYTWKFGDVNNNVLTTTLDTNVNLSYNGYGKFYPFLVARGSFVLNGINKVCESIYPDTSIIAKKEVVVNESPVTNLSWVTNCDSLSTEFYNNSTMSSSTIRYMNIDYGDGTSSGEFIIPNAIWPVAHSYGDTGTYTVIVWAVADNFCADSFVRDVKISPPPKPDFRFITACEEQTVLFFDSSETYNDYIKNWNWKFGDGSSSILKNPQKIFNLGKKYSVELLVLNSAGCSKKITKDVLVYSKPNPSFYANAVCFGDSTDFVNNSTSTQNLKSWKWNYGNGDSSEIYEPNYLYDTATYYQVALRLETVNGCVDSTKRWIFVDPNPDAIINHSNDSVQCFNQHHFDLEDNSKIASGSTVATWNWSNSTSSNLKIITNKTFGDTGIYRVELVSISNYGCTDTAYSQVRILPSVNPDFLIDDNKQCLNINEFTFTDQSNSSATYQVKWAFGDANYANSTQVVHSYSDSGIYKVQLFTETALGCRDTTFKSVQVYPMPKADVMVNNKSQCLTTNKFNFVDISKIGWGGIGSNWDFGDFTNSTLRTPQKTYSDTGKHTVTLISTSAFGCADTTSIDIWVREMPVVDFVINDSSQCLNQNEFIFTNNSTVNAGSIGSNWVFGDGTVSSIANPKKGFTSHGTFLNKLIVTSNFGCKDSVIESTYVRPMPVVSFSINDTDQCVNNNLFSLKSTSTIASGSLYFDWIINGDSSFSGNNLSINFNKDTNHIVKLIGTSDFACVDSLQRTLIVQPKPYPNFLIDTNSQCLRGNLFSFDNLTQIKYGTLNYVWDFGDGGSNSALKSPKKSYSKEGTYKVLLRVISDNLCEDTISKPIVIRPMPVAQISVDDSTQCFRYHKFNVKSQSLISEGTLSHQWQFSDNVSDTGMISSNSFSNYGSYEVKLISVSDFNCADTSYNSLTVYPMPVAEILINDTQQCINNQSFEFTDNSKIAEGSLKRKWIFFDSTGLSKVITRTFPNDTIYNTLLVQESDFGCLDTTDRKIWVWSKPMTSFTTSDSAQCLNQNFYRFTNQTTIAKGSLTYDWLFDETNSSSTDKDPGYFYSLYGFKRPLLKATSENGCWDTFSRIIRVNPMPKPAIDVNDTTQCFVLQRFEISDISTIIEGTTSANWLLSDGTISNQKVWVHNFPQDSTYTIKLISTSDQGCVDSTIKTVITHPSPKNEFRINDTVQCLTQNKFEFENLTRIKYGTVTYFWDLGDGTTRQTTLDTLTHIYKSHGRYYLRLISQSNEGCEDTSYADIYVGAMPEMSFVVNDEGQCIRNQQFLYFSNSKIAEGTFDHIWKFGDGTIDTSKADTSHYFQNIGSYNTVLLGKSNIGCMDSTQLLVYVNPNPEMSIVVNDSDQCINNQNFQFTIQANIERGSIMENYWDLGASDPNIYKGNIVNKYYNNSGVVKVRLIGESDSGCLDTTFKLIRIYPKPQAIIGINDTPQCLSVNYFEFIDNSNDSLGIVQWNWDIAGEKNSTLALVDHSFKTSGTKPIRLIVGNTAGCFDTIITLVRVKPMPNTRFTQLPDYYCQNTGTFSITPQETGGIFTGKNMVNSDYTPSILWRDTVKYVIQREGCWDSSEQYTWVYPFPVVDLGNDTTLCKTDILDIEIDNWNTTYKWSDGKTTPKRRITEPGTYQVIATNICGSISDEIVVNYQKSNCRLYLPTAFTPQNDARNDRYKPITYNVLEMKYTIYNRWGAKVYEGDLNDDGWDGAVNGALSPQGTYIVIVNYRYEVAGLRLRQSDRATFHLLR